MKFSLLSLFAILSVASAQPFGGCNVDRYYDDLGATKSWDKGELHALLQSTHRNVLPFTSREDPGTDDVWAAIIDLDPGSTDGTVHLAYEDTDEVSIPFGQRTWIKEHLFPILRGVGQFGPDYSDVHNIRPISPLTDIVRGNSYFGECGVLVREDTCIEPAEGAAGDTCSCNRVFTPPANLRGDIARALMYMDVRYDGSEPDTLDLRLTDCPFEPERDMAYLSQMLQWHAEDPPDEAERIRNDKACRNWQGNRNPFVDYPELAEQIYGEPLPLPAVGDRLIYEACEAITTEAPTFAPNQCDLFAPGDVQIWLMNSNEPDTIGLYSFVDLPEDFELLVTTNPWNGEEFLEQEGTLSFVVPQGGLDAGSVFGYGSGSGLDYAQQWEVKQGSFSMSSRGEPIFLYCFDSSGDPKILLAFNYGGSFTSAGLDSYGRGESALPENLGLFGLIDLPHYNNYLYEGPTDLSEEELKAALKIPFNWIGSDTERYSIVGSSSGPTSMNRRWLVGVGALAITVTAWAM